MAVVRFECMINVLVIDLMIKHVIFKYSSYFLIVCTSTPCLVVLSFASREFTKVVNISRQVKKKVRSLKGEIGNERGATY